ncbi:MAG: RNA polymerase sigma factor [Vampirovibrionia bacterium]
MTKSDAELIKACQKNNDLKAFETLIKRHQNKVRSVVYKFIKDTNDLDDISQEVFIKAFRSIKTYRSEAKFSTWLYRIAVNTCKDKLKSKHNKYNNVISIDEKIAEKIENTANDKTEDIIDLKADQKLVFKEIKNLPLKQQIVLILHDIEFLSYEEISKIANCPTGTVKSRLFNARKQLKEKLKPVISTIQLT